MEGEPQDSDPITTFGCTLLIFLSLGYMFYAAPDLVVYNSGRPHPYDHALPYTAACAVIAWVGFLLQKSTSLIIKILLALPTGIVTFGFLANLYVFASYHLLN